MATSMDISTTQSPALDVSVFSESQRPSESNEVEDLANSAFLDVNSKGDESTIDILSDEILQRIQANVLYTLTNEFNVAVASFFQTSFVVQLESIVESKLKEMDQSMLSLSTTVDADKSILERRSRVFDKLETRVETLEKEVGLTSDYNNN